MYNEHVDVSHTDWKTLTQYPEIESISFAGTSPVNLSPIFTTENWQWEGSGDEIHASFYRMNVDEDYLNVFRIPLVKGRFFSGAENDIRSVVINEKLQKVLGFMIKRTGCL